VNPSRRSDRRVAAARRAGWLVAALLTSALAAGGCAKRPAPVTGPVAPAPTGLAVPEGGVRTVRHTVKAGETLARIADNYYGDPARAAAIARDNGLDPGRDPAPDSVLDLSFAPAEWATAERRAVALDPYNRGVQALAQDRLGEAERLFRLAAETAPDLPDARYNLALVLLRRGGTDEAVTLLTRLTTQRPADAEYRCALGNALFQSARFADAAAQFAIVLQGRPDHRRAVFGQARALQECGRRAEAAAAWRHYLELDADSAWADIARAHLRQPADGR
jgi:Flp pilus assembly protein TadD